MNTPALDKTATAVLATRHPGTGRTFAFVQPHAEDATLVHLFSATSLFIATEPAADVAALLAPAAQ